MMEKLIKFLDDLKRRKFTGGIFIKLNQGGIISINEIKQNKIEL